MAESKAVTIEVPDNCEEEGHFIVSFSNGQVNNTSTNKPKFSLYNKKSGTAGRKKKIMVAETDNMSYVGTNYEENSQTASSNLCKYYVGRLDRKKRTMSLRRAELLHLRPYIPGKSDECMEEEPPVKRERSEVQDEMVALFGSEKQKRAFAAYKRNKVGTDALETALASAVSHAETVTDTPEEASTAPQGSGLAPPFNPQAETPHEVYNISDIISMEDLKAVKVVGKILTSASREEISQWQDEAIYPGYVLSRIPNIPSSEPERGLKAALLLYCGWLIQMYRQNYREFEKKGLQLTGEVPPAKVKTNLLVRFSETSTGGPSKLGKEPRRKITAKMKDKILLHLLVLSLVLDDFTVDCSILQKDLKVTTKKLMENYKSLGCRVSKVAVKRAAGEAEDEVMDTSSCTAVLRIPLEFPKPKRGRKKQ